MYSYEDRLNVIKLYFKYESYADVINELGYPSRMALRNWVKEYKGNCDVKKEITRQSKYTDIKKLRIKLSNSRKKFTICRVSEYDA